MTIKEYVFDFFNRYGMFDYEKEIIFEEMKTKLDGIENDDINNYPETFKSVLILTAVYSAISYMKNEVPEHNLLPEFEKLIHK